VSVPDPDNPYRPVALRGEVVSVTEGGADDHVDRLASEYLGASEYPDHDEEDARVILPIRPERVDTMHWPNPTPTGFLRYGLRRIRSAVGA